MYVSRSRTSCVGHHLTDPASSIMPHQRSEMGGVGIWFVEQETAYRINSTPQHPARPAELGLSVIKHKSLNGSLLSSWLHTSRISADRFWIFYTFSVPAKTPSLHLSFAKQVLLFFLYFHWTKRGRTHSRRLTDLRAGRQKGSTITTKGCRWLVCHQKTCQQKRLFCLNFIWL